MSPPNPAAVTPSPAVSPTRGYQAGFAHELLLYTGGDHGFLDGTLASVGLALAHEASVLVAVTAERADALRQALGEAAERVRFLDMEDVGRNPARIFPVWLDFAREHVAAGAGHALGISEPVWPGRTPAELSECDRHEALLNLAFDAGPGWSLLCPYDLDHLEDHVIEAARRAHPLLARDGTSPSDSDGYMRADHTPEPFAGSLPAPSAPAEELEFSGESLGDMRHRLSAWAVGHGLDDDGAEELVLAVNELAANSVRYGGGAGTLRCWGADGELLCEVQDQGHIHAPLTGRVRPAPDACSGRGVWLVNQLCDLVQIRSSATGSVVRVHKRLP
jgi:anti-sigma regulatory factor (Ser/Thr protein kinase)